jgi:hypothetical protein
MILISLLGINIIFFILESSDMYFDNFVSFLIKLTKSFSDKSIVFSIIV